MKIQITPAVHWIGKTDWELRKFHGEEYSTHRGSSYNSYLVQDEKTAVIDTVWLPFDKEYVRNLAAVVDLKSIDYIIANHAEIDHSGALPELMRHIPETPVYCTANGVKSLRGHYRRDWNFQVVKTGDTLSLGTKELVFIEAPMLHWPDTMMSYLTGDAVLFSNDAFGQHIADEHLFNDLVVQSELYDEAIKYYANILTPFSPMVTKKIEEILALKLPVNVICPSHGVVWRDNPLQIVQKYLEWAADYQENQITIIYDTMWDGTRKLAEAIAAGIREKDSAVTVKLYNAARRDINDNMTEVFKSKAILLGSPTINRGILAAMAALIEMMKGLKFKNKKAAAFGCYGWSGESVKILEDRLGEAGFTVITGGLKSYWEPGDNELEQAREFGGMFA
ncbi:MAG: anaerobic nitric oxide reductase flavorubredoxin [Syntrophales bacterium]|jgi:flavorubredoxin|nr:anaerobic nitric oxide reductase flavorubredoxin [Syntrophales bacterium]MCK9527675.1 anaerobic nitric oxide reductase flavorubredoxin [Syntrophales bacterium]MDX9921670.1 anaerobic nitric oxide reductase flavorubredoxin [Syntrophales bacterium]